ncbi:hypothetical protein WA158_001513 [Blastocystis sp. Blastoise]
MSTSDFLLTEDKYLFTFQEETKLWISREFIEKYKQFPFYDIIKHSDKYEDGTYYIDIPSSPMEKVIDFFMDDNQDIFTLNLRDSYDMYTTLLNYSVVIDNEKQDDLLFHIKELFIEYLKENNYNINGYSIKDIQSYLPMNLFNDDWKQISIKGLFTPQRISEFLYYSLLFKMMNITDVYIEYDYASNIPLEYIYPSNIKEIFPLLIEMKITVNTHYKKTELLLNPVSDEYIMEYIRLFEKNDNKKDHTDSYNYYTESEMNEYNKISSLDTNNIHYSHDLVDSYNAKRRKNQLIKIYKNIVNEAIYTNDYSKVDINETENEYILYDQIRIIYDYETNDKTFLIEEVSSEIVISQLLSLPSHFSFSKIAFNSYIDSKYESIIIINAFEKGVFDSLTTLNVKWVKNLTSHIDDNLFMKIMTTHIFPNVTTLEYNYDYYFQLSSIKKENFPKLHILDCHIEMSIDFDSIFPLDFLSMIDTIQIDKVDDNQEYELALLLDDLAYINLIHINITSNLVYYFPHLRELLDKNLISFDELYINTNDSDNVKKLDCFENYKQNIDCLNIEFNDDERHENKNSLERFLKSNVLHYLNSLSVLFGSRISIEYLTWISNIINDNKINTIHELTIDLRNITVSSSEYITAYENIMEKLISKASIIKIDHCYMSFINRLIPKGCFHNTTQLTLITYDVPDDSFYELCNTDHFTQIKSIECDIPRNRRWLNNFKETLCEYIDNTKFPLSTTIQLSVSVRGYVIDSHTSVLRCKQDNNTFINKIIGTKGIYKYILLEKYTYLDKEMSKFEIETLLDYIYDEEQLSKLINFITIGKIPKLKEFLFYMGNDISDEKSNMYKQQLNDSIFIQENHVNYKFGIFH